MPVNSLIVGVDLAPIKPIPRVITFQSDITTEKCRATIRQHLKTWKADTVLHDGAPNVGTAWAQDSFNQAELALQAMKLATEFLVEGGTFVTKVFRSKDYNPLLWVLNQLFTHVEATKPPSSRNVSAEIFVVCRGYKAPKRIDPQFLDPRSVFAELAGATPNNEAKVYNPEVKKRKRDGYDEGDYTLYKEVPASEFIQTMDPIAILGSSNKLTFQQPLNGDVALAALDKLPETTPEIRNCCSDLKTLGRRDFKLLLKWRLRVREIFGLATKEKGLPAASEEVAEIEEMDEELKIEEELQAMRDRDSGKRKREKRRENEKKQKEIVRMQMNMISPMDIGMEEAGPIGEGSMFALKSADQTEAMRRLNRGKMVTISEVKSTDIQDSDSDNDESDPEEDRLERDLDSMYDNYKERKAEYDAKYRAKKAREQRGDDEWEGLSAGEGEDSDSSALEEEDEDSSSEEDEGPAQGLLKNFDEDQRNGNGLSSRAAAFFNQEIFKGITDVLPENRETGDKVVDEDEEIRNLKPTIKIGQERQNAPGKSSRSSSWANTMENGNKIEVIPGAADDEDDWERKETRQSDGKPGKGPGKHSKHSFTNFVVVRYRYHYC